MPPRSGSPHDLAYMSSAGGNIAEYISSDLRTMGVQLYEHVAVPGDLANRSMKCVRALEWPVCADVKPARNGLMCVW